MTNSFIAAALADPRLAAIKVLLPRSIKRFLLLHVFGADLEPSRHPSRQWLERELLPMLPRLGFKRVMFVGTGPYTWHYERIVLRAGGEWITSDISPAAAVWGARRHVVADVQEIDRRFSLGYFDAVILNGVLGFGITTETELKTAALAMWRVLRPGGLLILGWNSDVIADPLNSQTVRNLFCAATNLPFPARHAFAAEAFVYDFQMRVKRDAAPC